jgi:hypothetical protein
MEPKIESGEEVIWKEGFDGLDYLSPQVLIVLKKGEKCFDFLVHKVRFNTVFISWLGLDDVPEKVNWVT